MNTTEKSLHFINSKSEKYARAKADRVYLEEFRKSQKAILINQAEREGRKTGLEREAYAYAHEDYINLLAGIREAIQIEEKLRWQLFSAKENINYQNQQNMMRMAEMKLR